MKKHIMSLVAILALIQSSVVIARELRAPLPFRNGFQRFEHYPYICEDVDKCWDFDAWGGAWHRQAGDAFRHGTKKETLAQLIFGEPSFFLINAFPPATGNGGNIALTLAELTPLINYSENGVMFGFNVNRRLDCGKWDVGVRLDMPFRAVTVTADTDIGTEAVQTLLAGAFINNPGDETVTNNDGTPALVAGSFAYRLDILAALPLPGGNGNFVNFSNPGFAGQITIDNFLVTDAAGPQASPVHVLGSTVTPRPPFSAANDAVDALNPLPADGSGLANGNRARFGSAVNYTPLGNNAVNQRRLYVVPTDFNQDPADPASPLSISAVAQQISADATALVQAAANSPTIAAFLAARGITFNTQRLTGAGDLDVDFYARRNFCGCHGPWYVEGIAGVRLPTGKRVENPGELLAQPLGNNRHFEIKGGAQVGWNPCDWFAMKADFTFYHVFKRTERVASAFVGATIRNIGTPVDAKISWNYLLANLDFTFYRQGCDSCSGVDIGYQPYYKFKDNVSFEQLTALDLLGNVQTLDATLLERNSKRNVHRIKTEMFHKTCDWEMYGGWLHSIAGRNIQRETDWYLGFGIFF